MLVLPSVQHIVVSAHRCSELPVSAYITVWKCDCAVTSCESMPAYPMSLLCLCNCNAPRTNPQARYGLKTEWAIHIPVPVKQVSRGASVCRRGQRHIATQAIKLQMQLSCSRGIVPHALVPRGLRSSRPTRKCRLVVLAAALQAKGDRFFAEDLKVKNALGEGVCCCCTLRSSSVVSMLVMLNYASCRRELWSGL